jgi:hypothetical protein
MERVIGFLSSRCNLRLFFQICEEDCFPDTVDMKRVVFYMEMSVFLVFGESFLFLTHDKNLPDVWKNYLPKIWKGSSSGYLERIFFRIFGEGCHCNIQYAEDYFPEAIYSEKYGT